MITVQSSEAKAKFSALLKQVARGETIDITLHGKSIARLVPPAADETQRRENAIQALRNWRRAEAPTGVTMQDLLEARDESRR